jgi:hypothetical protein
MLVGAGYDGRVGLGGVFRICLLWWVCFYN